MKKKINSKQTEENKLTQDQGPEEPQDLNYDEQKDSYEMDVGDEDPDWEHPIDYDTLGRGAQDDDSTYDEANPYIGDEYADDQELKAEALDDQQMHIDSGQIVQLSSEDEKLAEDAEDLRDDVDEEGYPINDKNDEKGPSKP